MDGVLLDRHPDYPEPYRSAVAAAFEAFDVDPADADLDPFCGFGKSIEGMRAECERHGLAFEAFWPERERQSSLLQRELMDDGHRDCFDDVAVLPDLAETHALGIVSNNQQATVDAVQERFELDGVALGDLFEMAYGRAPSVEGYRRRKPDTHYVERALEDLGTRSALFVGDRESDLVVARRVGLDAALLCRDGASAEALSETPTYEIGTLTELQGMF